MVHLISVAAAAVSVVLYITFIAFDLQSYSIVEDLGWVFSTADGTDHVDQLLLLHKNLVTNCQLSTFTIQKKQPIVQLSFCSSPRLLDLSGTNSNTLVLVRPDLKRSVALPFP